MKFSEYATEREKAEIVSLLAEHGISPTEEQVQTLLEAGWLSRAKSGLAKGALLASLPLAMSANWANHQPQPYHFQGDRLMANHQRFQDEAADKAYVDAGGPEYKQTAEDAEAFLKFRSTPQHREALKRAGLPGNYIPSPVRSFVYGDKISAVDSMTEESVRSVENGIKKAFGRDSFVSISQSEDTVTGGKIILVSAKGVVMAMNEQDAVRRAEVIIREIAKNEGFDVQEFKDMHAPDIDVRLAPRSTVDLSAEAAGRPFGFNVKFKMVAKR